MDLLRQIGFGGLVEEHSIIVPSKPIFFPKRKEAITQVQQLKTVNQNRSISAQQSAPSTISPNTQGVPQPLIAMRVRTSNTSATTKQLTVGFHRNPSDTAYQSANIYLKTGKGNPVLIAQGTDSPIRVSVARTQSPSSVIVQPVGTKGATPVANSLSRAVKLL